MDFALSDYERTWQARGHVLGRELAPDASATTIVASAARLGLLDQDATLLSYALAVEALARDSAAAAVTLSLHASVMLQLATDARAGALSRGEVVGAVGLSSDALPMARGERASGRASWVGPFSERGLAVIGVRHDDALTAGLIALDSRGVTVEPIPLAALPGIQCGNISLDEARVELVGTPLTVMARGRVLLAAAGVGMGRRATREALHAARAYGRTGAGGEQTVQGLLADAATELDAAAMLVWKAASVQPVTLGAASMAKLAASDAAQRAVARATQVVGVETFRRGHIIEQLAQDVRALELFAGRTEALREAIAEETLGSPLR